MRSSRSIHMAIQSWWWSRCCETRRSLTGSGTSHCVISMRREPIQTGSWGELHEPETHLIPLVLFTAMGLRPSIQVFGGDYATPDVTCVRDYIHVSDLADAHVAALEWIAADKSSNSFNLGNDRGFSVAEVIRTAEDVTGSAIKAQMCPRRPGDPPTLVSDSTKARQLLNWKPKFPALKEQIDHAFRWFRDEMQQLATIK